MQSSDVKPKLKISQDEIASNSEIFFTSYNKEAKAELNDENKNTSTSNNELNQNEQANEVIEIPQEIELLAKNYSNYSITIDSFTKYKFYKKYCVDLANN